MTARLNWPNFRPACVTDLPNFAGERITVVSGYAYSFGADIDAGLKQLEDALHRALR
jgi:hypothetical protein